MLASLSLTLYLGKFSIIPTFSNSHFSVQIEIKYMHFLVQILPHYLLITLHATLDIQASF